MRFAWFAGAAVALSCVLTAQGQRGDPAAVWKHLKERYDENGDGKVSEAEYSRGEDKFTRFDRDGDGFITDSDFERGARRGGGNRNRGGGNRRNRGAASSQVAMVGVELAKNADADRSGSVTAAEWSSYIDSLETGEDGVVAQAKLFGGGGGRMGGYVTRMADLDRDSLITTSDLEEIFIEMDGDENGELQRSELGKLPWPGEVAPDFELPFAEDTDKTVKLSSFRGAQPVALIFGSYT